MNRTIVVVDDERVFDFPAHYLRTLEDAMEWLTTRISPINQVSELWLDHDLGGSDEEPIDVRPLVRQLEEAVAAGFPYEIDTIVVCTDNPVGRAYIHAALDRYYHVIDIPIDVKWRLLK